jgi:M6 family metalloprotease-like protein
MQRTKSTVPIGLWPLLQRTLAGFATMFMLVAPAPAGHTLDARAFGWQRAAAAGARPLLVIWLRVPDNTPAGELARRKQHYEDLIFGRSGPPSDYPDAMRGLEPSLADFYRDMSGGRFTWRRAGFIGPLTLPEIKEKNSHDEAGYALTVAANHFDFRPFDTNHDGKISATELAVLVIDNKGVSGGQADHFMQPVSGKREKMSAEPRPIPGQGVSFAGADAVAGEGGFATFAHELFHGLGGIDMYGPWHGCYSLSNHLTLMAGTGGNTPDDENIFHLDPWHKMLVGWIEPRVYAISKGGTAQLAAQHVPTSAEPERKRPVLLYDPAKGTSDFFMLEYRTPYRLGYDRDVASSGLVIWHIAYDKRGLIMEQTSERKNCKGEFVKVPSIYARGAPDWGQGTKKAWTSADGDIVLKWMNGLDTAVRVTVAPHKPSDTTLEIKWSLRNEAIATGRER